MTDFNSGTRLPNKFGGSEAKTTLLYKGDTYMIKYPDPVREKKNELSYMNNQFSEHIGCQIFSSCGIKSQETALGRYRDINGKEKIVVACKDFTQDGSKLYEFSKFANDVLTEGDSKGRLTMESINEVIDKNGFIDAEKTKKAFWDMFVVDALIGNSDRHLDNWGILEKNGEFGFAPIYDCGSSLAALKSDGGMKGLLIGHTASEDDFRNHEYNTMSCYSMNGKRIRYHEIFKKPPSELAHAIRRIVPKIDIPGIHEIINNVSSMSDTRKEYLVQATSLRYQQILAPALKKLEKQ